MLGRVSAIAGRAALGLTTMTTCATASVFEIPRLDTVVIDGDVAEWDKAFHVDVLLPVNAPLPARPTFSAAARLGWNAAGLLVLVTVTGTNRHEAAKLDELWKGDSVELYLASSPSSPDRCQWVIAPGLSERFPKVRSFLHDHRQSAELKRQPAAATVASRPTATGYQIAALLPWPALGIVPELQREVVCQIMVNNHERDQQPQDHLVWFPLLGAYSDSQKMHQLRLAQTGQPPAIARLRGRVNRRIGQTEFEVLAPPALAGQPVRVRTTDGVLASGTLQADTSGYARVQLAGPNTERAEAILEVSGKQADVLPLLPPPLDTPARAWTIDTRVQAGPAVVLTLPASPSPYTIARREPGQPWTTLAMNAPPGKFRDAGATTGKFYEYAVQRAGETPATDYFCAGNEAPLVDQRGTVVLLVEQSQAGPLTAEIRRLLFDLVGDGWQVVRHDVAINQTPAEVKRLIQAQPADAVFLLGHVPVPYSGDLRPDGHDDHVGAWPADVFYGALEGEWTDSSVTQTNPKSAARQHNVPGDGKFDQSEIPGPVQLAVGRVDFHDLPAFGLDETALLRRYLDRLHAYRQGEMPVETRGWVQDNFSSHPERFAYSGWQNLTTLLGPENVVTREWPNVEPGMHLWFAGCGPGGHESMAGFGTTQQLVTTPLNAVFAFLFGSYFADWDVPNNLMRAALASDGSALTCGWAGRPHWFVHPLGMGATIGDCLRLTQNNPATGYQPAGSFPRGVHIALLGDPTLRMHRVRPPLHLKARTTTRGMRLSWQAAPQAGVTYHVYRAATELGPYERLTELPIEAREFTDPQGAPGNHYMVRAIALQLTPTGSYYNASQAAFANQ